MPIKASVLTKAVLKAVKEMGISTAYLGKIIGKDEKSIREAGIKPESKSGELSLMLISCYRNLYVLAGGNSEYIKHWKHTKNKGTEGIPVKQILYADGLVRVTQYLDEMKSKM